MFKTPQTMVFTGEEDSGWLVFHPLLPAVGIDLAPGWHLDTSKKMKPKRYPSGTHILVCFVVLFENNAPPNS